MALSDFATPELWRKDLDARWPERLVMKRLLRGHLIERLSENPNARVLELGIGDGELLMALNESLPQLQLIAMDINQTLLDRCNELMSERNFSPICTDLSRPWSEGYENSFSAVYSLQSVHDFGGREALTSTYQEIASVLEPGGIVLNADFVVPFPQDKDDSPRRFPVETHLQILRECGFTQATVLHKEGLLGLITAKNPN
ncbi:MAG: methyltransferase domain-containing protein [Pseudomonadales bacterium]|nr:methyltransferase domain-containing protein [Pseudomonadales bacterium]